MDAANLSFKRIALPLAFALLIPAAASAQQFSTNPTSVLLSGANAGSVAVTSTTAGVTEIPYTATITYTAGDPEWLCISSPPTQSTGSPTQITGLTTPSNLTLSVANCGVNTGPSFTGTHMASITLSSSLAGVTSVVIPVSYTVGSGGNGGTGGTVTAFPSSITQTVSYGFQTGQIAITLSTSSTSAITYTLPTSAVSWLTVVPPSGGNTGVLSSNNPATFYVILNGAGQAQASLSTSLAISTSAGNLTIPITLNNGVNGSGGNGGSISVSPTSINWSYSTSNGVFPNPANVTVVSTNGAVTYSATANSSGNWLLVNGNFAASGIAGQTALTISPSSQLATLSPGTYNGTVTVTDSSDSNTAVINVIANVTGANSGSLTISPSPISLSASANGSIASATVTVTSAVSGTLTATVSGANNSLSVSGSGTNVAANVPASLTIFGNPSGLSSNTYVGTLNVSVGGNTAGAQVNFVVGGGSTGGSTTGVAPTQLNFVYEPNTSMSTSEQQQVYVGGSGSFTVNSSATWLIVSPTTGTLPATLYVFSNASGLAPSTYSTPITITNTSTGVQSTVNATLLVTGTPALYATPFGDAIFNYNAASPSTIPQYITVAASDNSIVPVNAIVTSATPWLTVSVSGSSSSTPTQLTINANGSNLANGVYSGSISVTPLTGSANALTIPIVLVVTGSSVTGSGTLTLSASALTLPAQVNGGAVTTTLGVTSSTNITYTATAQGNYNGINWLTVSPSGTLTTGANSSLTVIANPLNFPAGNYSGTISLTANGSTQVVIVTMSVGGTAGGGAVTVTANGVSSASPTLTFTAASVGSSVASQYLSVTSASGSSAVNFTASASTTSGGNWLQLGIVSGQQYQTPLTTLAVTASTTVNGVALAAGTYTGQIAITPVGGTAVSVPVTLTIGGQPTVVAPTTPLSFSYAAGGAAPATQTVALTVSNATTASFTATAAGTPSGLFVVTPATGTAPSNLVISTDPTVLAGLSAGAYSGTITVAGSSGSTGSSTIPVTLTVTVPLPTVTKVTNAASFASGSIAPGEIISIFGTNIGPVTPATLTLDSTGKFVTTTLGGVQVLVNGYSAPLAYVSSTQINAVVPYEIAGIQNPTLLVKTNVTSSTGGQTSNGFSLNAAATALGIFTQNGSGTGPGAILNSDSITSNAATAAARGTVVVVYLTGEGQTTPAGVDGKVTTAPFPAPLLPIAITVGGAPATYQFAGEAPGFVAGVMQLNVLIPATLNVTGPLALSVSIGPSTSQTGVTVNVK